MGCHDPVIEIQYQSKIVELIRSTLAQESISAFYKQSQWNLPAFTHVATSNISNGAQDLQWS